MKVEATDPRLWIRKALERYQRPLIQYAFRLTGDLDRARDVVQDTFLRLCSQKPERVQDHLAQWLFKVCRNRAFDVLKKENRMTSLSLVPESAWENPGADPGLKLETRDQLNRVSRILDDLSENQQEVVRLRFQAGLSYREISQVTGLTAGNVGFLLHSALKNIRQRMQDGALTSRSDNRRAK